MLIRMLILILIAGHHRSHPIIPSSYLILSYRTVPYRTVLQTAFPELARACQSLSLLEFGGWWRMGVGCCGAYLRTREGAEEARDAVLCCAVPRIYHVSGCVYALFPRRSKRGGERGEHKARRGRGRGKAR
jgi:hypothetical protein